MLSIVVLIFCVDTRKVFGRVIKDIGYPFISHVSKLGKFTVIEQVRVQKEGRERMEGWGVKDTKGSWE